MDVRHLVFADDAERVVALACGKCGRVYGTDHREAVAECCDAELAKQRKAEREAKWEADDRAKEAARVAKAKRVPEAEYGEGPVYWEDGKGYDDGFFDSLQQLREWCEDESVALPAEVWACSRRMLRLPSAESLIESELDEHHESVTVEDCVGMEELQAAIDAWNAKQTQGSIEPDYSRRVVLAGGER